MTERAEAAVWKQWKTWTATWFAAASLFMGCGTWIGNPKGSASSPTGGGSAGNGFPVDLMLSSPTGPQENSASLMLTSAPMSPYKNRTEKLATLLHSKVGTECRFDLKIERNIQNVACFGPEIYYRHHPDGTDRSRLVDATTGLYALPPGDVGMASAVMPSTGEACSSAQLNQGAASI